MKKWLLAGGVVGLLLCAGAVLVQRSRLQPPTGVSEDTPPPVAEKVKPRFIWKNVGSVKAGMTQEDVISVLGGPPGNYSTRDHPGRLAWNFRQAPNSRWELWSGDAGELFVEFDVTDLVKQKHIIPWVARAK